MARKYTEQHPAVKPLMKRVKKRREKLELSVRAAAGKVGIDHATWWQFENGGRNPTVDSLALMAKALGGKLIIDIDF